MFEGIGIIIPIDTTGDGGLFIGWVVLIAFGLLLLGGFLLILHVLFPRLLPWWSDRILLNDVNWVQVERFQKRRILRLFLFIVYSAFEFFGWSILLDLLDKLLNHSS